MQKHLLLVCIAGVIGARAGAAQTHAGFVTLYSFSGQNGDGYNPAGSLIVGDHGSLFGTTEFGGSGPCKANSAAGCGTVFELSPPASGGGVWTERVLYSFGSSSGDGEYPYSRLAFGPGGKLYGTTTEGGARDSGTVFELSPPTDSGATWTESVIYSFGGDDGAWPYSGVTLGPSGALYGTTIEGGAYRCGTLFALRPPASAGNAWSLAVLHTFSGMADGCQPYGDLAVTSDGMLYGTTAYGALSNGGTVFSRNLTSGNETVLYTFGTQLGDGEGPLAGVTLAASGTLYGTNSYDGLLYPASFCFSPIVGCGTAFELQRNSSGGAWAETVLHEFTALDGDGANPSGGLVIGKEGALFGTTPNPGTVYQLIPSAAGQAWTETILHTFTGQNEDGWDPNSNPVIGPGGELYGTTLGGGTAGKGTVWALTPR